MNASDLFTELRWLHLIIIGAALLFYDYLLTLDLEISRYWGARISWSTVLFFVNRYGSLLGNVPVVIQRFWTTPSTPEKTRLEYYHQWFVIVTQIIIGVMLILRTYALYERNKRVLGLMLAIGACVIAACIWGTVFSEQEVHEWPGIIHAQSTGLIVAWASMASRHSSARQLLSVLLRDGIVVAISNVSNILTFILYTRGVVTTFANIISSILISRLMLSIRNPALWTMSSNAFSESDRNIVEFSTYMIPSELSTQYTYG
ncbi:hypothetical protein B0H12DRAFT_1127497 [Mycena haematopus]|nr:hypothetical protein B0H12DRAFT_1127497 [Mycena haematopus]